MPEFIDPDQAATVFASLASAVELAWGFPADGCYARTHLMVEWLLEKRLAPFKVWAFASDVTDPLWTETPAFLDGRVQWGYHVAPVLMVGGSPGEAQEMVLDPVLFDCPVSVEEWKHALNDTPTVVRTALGEPPVPSRGGSGYWPGSDPIEGPDWHARETLEEYRGKTPE